MSAHDDLTVCELDALCKRLFLLREEYEELKFAASEKLKSVEDLERTIEFFLDSHGKSKYHLSGLGTISVQEKMSFRVPKDPESKDAFFKYLRYKGVFDSMVTVNSQTLNAFCKAELESRKTLGNDDFSIPGIETPTTYKQITIRKEK